MLRITASASPPHTVTLRLEGQVIGRWVAELQKSCDEVTANGDRVVLDLVGVSFIDKDGLSLLNDLADHDISLVNSSRFVAELLKEGGS
jgi:anti-anti-sigma regulatory factor